MHPLTEIIEARIRLLFSLFHDSLDEVAAHILDRIQTETNLAVVRREAAVRDIDVRRKHLDAQAGALARILDDFVGIVKHTGEQCGHKLAGVMTLEISRLECDISVAGRMAFIEGVGRKTRHFIVNFVGNFLGDAIGDTARAFVARLGAAMDKMLAFCLHHRVLLFTHGTADVICLSERETGQLTEYLHDLFLVDDAAVGDVKDVGQLRGLIADFIRLVAVAQVGRDGVHRAGAVKTDKSDDIFKVLWLQTHEDLFHTRGFELEHALRFTLTQHLISRCIVIIQLLDGEGRVFFLNGSLRVPDDRQGTQAEEVHFQQAQLFDLGHIELGDRQAVVGGQGQIIICRFRGNDGRMGGGVAGHSFNFQRSVDKFCDLRVAVVHPLELR